ncbi:MAG: hypothetical protein CM15mP86_03220 [Gammaproteobacteria bacterium]|nr:MAG: hypothetical protein CM15mP86_03220 [Gammaproteobacteria bacterium]
MFSSTITIINSLGLVLFIFLVFQHFGKSTGSRSKFIERISSLEESPSENQKVIDELSQNIDAEFKFVNKEIRKLGISAIKEIEKNITANLNSIKGIQNKLTEFAKSMKL